MDFTVMNGEFIVDYLKVTYLSTSSVCMVGDIRSISLTSAYETPPEKVIIGVTNPIIKEGSP